MIFCDIDEVLIEFIRPCCKLLKDQYGITVEYDQANTFDWFEIPGSGITKDLWYNIISNWKYEAGPYDGAIDFTHQLAAIDDITYITARDTKHRADTERQLSLFAPGKLVMTSKSKLKLDYILNSCDHGTKVIIEDHPRTATECAENGIRAYLVHRPINYGFSHHAVTKVANYNDILTTERKLRGL